MEDLVTVLGYVLAGVIIVYIIYVIAKQLVLEYLLDTGKYRIGKIQPIPVKESFCRVSDEHVHYRVEDKIKYHDREKHVDIIYRITYYLCPLTGKIELSSVTKDIITKTKAKKKEEKVKKK